MSPIKTETSERKTWSFRLTFIAIAAGAFAASASASPVELVISVPEQKLYVFDEAGEKVAAYRVSTSAHGIGDGRGTYATPLGKLEVAAKIGEGAPVGSVFKAGHRTGEVVPVNAKGRDPIVTRILHLRGLEAQNAQAFARCIYIHGTPDEKHLGKPASYGCIRMASSDVMALFESVGVGTQVEITSERVTGVFGGIARRQVQLQAVASAPVQTETKAAVSTKAMTALSNPALLPQHSTPVGRIELTPRTVEPSKTIASNHSSGSHVKLLETSGLTVNFGGGVEASDRPR